MTPYALGRKPSARTPKAARLYPSHHTDAPLEAWDQPHRFWWDDGAKLDQGSEGTCVGHAFAHRRADAKVRVEGITHQWARQLYFDITNDTTYQLGAYSIDACEELQRRGDISAFFWVTDANELSTTLLHRGPVCVGTPWFNDMFFPEKKFGNQYLNVSGHYEGGHEYVINGIELSPEQGPPFYRLKNSWGTSWGQGGNARIAVNDLNDLIFSQGGDAVLIKEVAP